MKMQVAVIFGGRTVEHDVSIVTGQQLIENIDKSKYNVIPVYIARDGQWYTGEKLLDISFLRTFEKYDRQLTKVYISPLAGVGGLVKAEKSSLFAKKDRIIPIDVVIPAMHGLNGEDGTLQGLLEFADIPYTSSGVLGSAAGMDKILMKAAFNGSGIPTLESEYFLREEWEEHPDEIVGRIEAALPYPMFVKPANLGSSIGISKVSDREALYRAIEVATQYDRRVLIDRGVSDITEYNCSVRGYSGDIQVSLIEQPVTWKEFLTFDEKYLRSGQSKGMKSMGRLCPAPISEELAEEIRSISVKIFKLFDCKGVVRIDYIYDNAQKQLYANEINTIPGSFAYYLWETIAGSYTRQIDTLIDYALRAHHDKNRSVYAYDSDMLKKNAGAKGTKSKLSK